MLLHAAVKAGDTLERIDRLVALCPAAGLTANTDLVEAMQLMNGVRTALIRCADELAADPSAR